MRELADDESLIVADGEEYRACEPLKLPSGTGAVFSEGNSTQRRQHQDAVGVLRLGGTVCWAVADGIGRLPDSGVVASFFVRTSLEVARDFRKAGRPIQPYLVTSEVDKQLRITALQGHPIDGATVGSFGILNPDGTVWAHRFGDPQFAIGENLNGSVTLSLAPHPNLLPQNEALEERWDENYDLKRILNPPLGLHRITHFLDGRAGRESELSNATAQLSLKPGDWWMVFTDGAQLYRKAPVYKAWFHQHPEATPSDLVHVASLMTAEGHDNGAGIVYRQGA